MKEKTKEEILDQLYISPSDLKILIPEIGIDRCRKYIKEFRGEMEAKGLFVPQTKPRVALTKLVKEKLGL